MPRTFADRTGDARRFIEFMLDKILLALKAKGEAYEAEEESRVKSRDKSRDKVLCLNRYVLEHSERVVFAALDSSGALARLVGDYPDLKSPRGK